MKILLHCGHRVVRTGLSLSGSPAWNPILQNGQATFLVPTSPPVPGLDRPVAEPPIEASFIEFSADSAPFTEFRTREIPLEAVLRGEVAAEMASFRPCSSMPGDLSSPVTGMSFPGS